MKKEYVKPISEIESYETADVVATSIIIDIVPNPPTDNKEPDLDDDDIYDIHLR